VLGDKGEEEVRGDGEMDGDGDGGRRCEWRDGWRDGQRDGQRDGRRDGRKDGQWWRADGKRGIAKEGTDGGGLKGSRMKG